MLDKYRTSRNPVRDIIEKRRKKFALNRKNTSSLPRQRRLKRNRRKFPEVKIFLTPGVEDFSVT